MHNKKYCNTECCNSIKREVEYILLTFAMQAWSRDGAPAEWQVVVWLNGISCVVKVQQAIG